MSKSLPCSEQAALRVPIRVAQRGHHIPRPLSFPIISLFPHFARRGLKPTATHTKPTKSRLVRLSGLCKSSPDVHVGVGFIVQKNAIAKSPPNPTIQLLTPHPKFDLSHFPLQDASRGEMSNGQRGLKWTQLHAISFRRGANRHADQSPQSGIGPAHPRLKQVSNYKNTLATT